MMGNLPPDAHWRDSARRPRFFGLDARAALLIFVCLLHIRWWTFILALVGIIFLAILEQAGFTLMIFVHWFRTQLAGPRKIAIPWWKR